jgi:hypothetical protein
MLKFKRVPCFTFFCGITEVKEQNAPTASLHLPSSGSLPRKNLKPPKDFHNVLHWEIQLYPHITI